MTDNGNSGTKSFKDLKHGLNKVGSNMLESEIKDLMDTYVLLFRLSYSI